MRSIFLILCIVLVQFTFGQHLYPEKFSGCVVDRFCLDCGDPKAQPPRSFGEELVSRLDQRQLSRTTGTIVVQVLVDSLGRPCLLSAQNETRTKLNRLKLEEAINSTSDWSPAINNKGVAEKVSVTLALTFIGGRVVVHRREFDPSRQTNMRSVGEPKVKGSRPNDLSVQWEVFDQSNSYLPWDMSRTVVTDSFNNVWVGTDNGLVKISGGRMEVFHSGNAPFRTVRGRTTISGLVVDIHNAIWFTDGYYGYRYNHSEWTVFDTVNHPLRWTTGLKTDSPGNIYFLTFHGIRKYNDGEWIIIDQSNTPLPSNNIREVYFDSHNRMWIGTTEGNIRVDGELTVVLDEPESPLSKAYITKMHEDVSGNLWFNLYSRNNPERGLWILTPGGDWISVNAKNPSLFKETSINDFLLDERSRVLWIALGGAGLARYDLDNEKWEIYTPENSNVPSTHVSQLTIDHDGVIWGATFAGVIRLVK